MHPGAYARESAIAQERIVAASQRIGAALGIEADIPHTRVKGDLNALQVSALKQRQGVADFLERAAHKLNPIAVDELVVDGEPGDPELLQQLGLDGEPVPDADPKPDGESNESANGETSLEAESEAEPEPAQEEGEPKAEPDSSGVTQAPASRRPRR